MDCARLSERLAPQWAVQGCVHTDSAAVCVLSLLVLLGQRLDNESGRELWGCSASVRPLLNMPPNGLPDRASSGQLGHRPSSDGEHVLGPEIALLRAQLKAVSRQRDDLERDVENLCMQGSFSFSSSSVLSDRILNAERELSAARSQVRHLACLAECTA